MVVQPVVITAKATPGSDSLLQSMLRAVKEVQVGFLALDHVHCEVVTALSKHAAQLAIAVTSESSTT